MAKSLGDSRLSEHTFFTGMAVAIAVTAIVGFSRTYFLRPALPEPVPSLPALTPLIHLHGAPFTGWVFLYLAQAQLIAGKRVDLHRKFGIAGAALAAGIIATLAVRR